MNRLLLDSVGSRFTAVAGVSLVAVLSLTGCSDTTAPVSTLRDVPNTAHRTAVPTPAPNVRFTAPNSGILDVSAFVQTVGGLPTTDNPLNVTVDARTPLGIKGSFAVTAAPTCPSSCTFVNYFGWTDPFPLPDQQLFLTKELSESVGNSSQARTDFTFSTQAPAMPGVYFMGAGQLPFGTWFSGEEAGFGYPLGATDTSTKTTASVRVTVNDPAILDTIIGGTISNGWYTSSPTIRFSILDPLSLVFRVSFPCFQANTPSTDGKAVTVTCLVGVTDSVEKHRDVTIKLDATKPVISKFAYDRAANASSWYKASVTAGWTCDDATSGPVNTTGSATVTTEGANQSVTATCTDNAGNTATEPHTGLNVDLTPPTLAPTLPSSTVDLNATVVADPHAIDALSGIASASCDPVDTKSSGQHTIQCTATDIAGNTASAPLTYTVRDPIPFGGFQSPISSNASAVNSAKAGSAVPVTFSLGGNRGLTILAPGYPLSRPVACSSTAPVSTIPESTTSNAGGSVLQYDATTQLYTYIWKTDKSWSGSCRTLVLVFTDGIEHTATFKFK